jgi:hypothetical protein
MVKVIPIGRRCNIHQILKLDNNKTFSTDDTLDGMVSDLGSSLALLEKGYDDDDISTYDNRITTCRPEDPIFYAFKQWNHKFYFYNKIKFLQPGEDASQAESICTWVHNDPRSPNFKQKFNTLRNEIMTQSRNSEIVLLYMSKINDKPLNGGSSLSLGQEELGKIHKFILRTGAPFMYINLIGCNPVRSKLVLPPNQTNPDFSNKFYLLNAFVPSSLWYARQNILDLDLSVTESKKVALQILRAVQSFARCCFNLQVP